MPPPPEHPRPRSFARELALDVVVDVALIAALILVSLAIEGSRVGRALALAAYEWQQGDLASKPQKIAIVDISKLTPVPMGPNKLVTPRDKLLAILKAIASGDAAAIGIDVNFAPDKDGNFITPGDEQFFKACAELTSGSNKPVPVVLAVSADGGRKPANLIHDPDFGRMAGTIAICEDTRRIPLWLEYGATRVTSFCAALAATLSPIDRRPRWPTWFAQTFFEKSCGKEPAEEFLVDYSALSSLESHDYTVHLINPQCLREMGEAERFFQGKLVLLGDTQLDMAVDKFNVLTRVGEAPVPGVYIHACGANTLLTGMISELTLGGRVMVDALLSGIALAFVTLVRLYYRESAATERVKVLSAYFVAFVAVAAVGWLAAHLRVLWLDFYVVLALLIVHPIILPQLRDAFAMVGRICDSVLSRTVRRRGQDG